ncbi:C40 family peptidase [Clostridium estertheticum]|uniref:C40 family peptidase n=1 Tax=Clostridium estertheticum TaxID=238834 RepID=UPI0013E91C0C|nr:C40 family peptidase [Clostridium estertheticum]MBZ9686096.1 C40 family peptidase [Clostridium estertheticum]
MKKVKRVTSFALALLVAGSISINSANVQAKGAILGTGVASSAKQTELTGATIVAYAKKLTGIPYKSGGTTKAGFDCSGFTKYVYSQFDITLPRTAKDQTSKGTVVSKANLRVGDLVFFGAAISHVGMYVGDGMFIHSPKPGSSVKIAELKYMPNYNTARRII